MKIAHIIETPGTGGAEKLLVDIAAGLPADFTSVGVMMCESWSGRELEKRGIAVTVMPLRRAFDASWPMRFAKFIRAQKVDVVQSHEFTANIYASMGARLAGVPIVCTTHGKNYWPHALYRRTAYRWAAHNAHAFVAVSGDLSRYLSSTLGIAEKRVRTIPNGIDSNVFKCDARARESVRAELSISATQPLLLACGELTQVKGHQFLLHAMRQVVATCPDAVVAIAGHGPLREDLEALAQSIGVSPYVRFLGFRDDVPALLNAADVFVMPSLSEGLPLALLEAMSVGVPVVATAVGGVPELIQAGETGWLVPPHDADELARMLIEVIRSSGSRQCVVGKARQLCSSQYDLRATVSRYADLYRSKLRH
jgi:glycosyltransferase involved in cell wall biosynthesis